MASGLDGEHVAGGSKPGLEGFEREIAGTKHSRVTAR